jgi:hypothetical protein
VGPRRDYVQAKYVRLRGWGFGLTARGRLKVDAREVRWRPYVPQFFMSSIAMKASEITCVREERGFIGSSFAFDSKGASESFTVLAYKRLRALLERAGFTMHSRPSWPGTYVSVPRGKTVRWSSTGPVVEDEPDRWAR